ncbi:Serine/threonine-protein phosphatase 6 regulatory ankyrin repeat subunit C [Cytospora mali]|uniref:Serine/threonine-protein phosphatase 6 regulatory ankyrin repeat subunit C n=1 Tax=Cytospora mali TaxID=578113 RepID=A0A194VYD7_CYTMA|nr:Serine/threonine-protein phosphatase 6 regulatory ankyrin repeat subunit C [Valsa mali]
MMSSSGSSSSGSKSPVESALPEPAGEAAVDGFQDAKPMTPSPPNLKSGELTITWTSAEEVDETKLDIVVVPGLYGSGEELTEEEPSTWTQEYLKSFGKGSNILLYQYDTGAVLAGSQTGAVLRSHSVNLLKDIIERTGDETPKRNIMFVADDIGGLIVKDALALAANSNDAAWLDILDRARILIFRRCPNRSADRHDMEENIAELIFAKMQVANIRPSLSMIPGLVSAVLEINGFFIMAKIHLRAHLISIYSDAPEQSPFDRFSGTFGLPCEDKIAEITGDSSGSKEEILLLRYLQDLKFSGTWPQAKDAGYMQSGYEQTLLSLASNVYPLRTPERVKYCLTEFDAYNKWYNATDPQILYVYGGTDLEETSEQLFYQLDKHAQNLSRARGMPLYFSFGHGSPRNTIKAMLSTFLAQIICHQPSQMGSGADIMFVQLNEEHGWTDLDLVQWFEYIYFRAPFRECYFVIHDFDNCPEDSRKVFLGWLSRCIISRVLPLKVAITSSKPGALSRELDQWPSIDLDASNPSEVRIEAWREELDNKRLLRHRPDLLSLNEELQKELITLSGIDPLTRSIILDQAKWRSEWPTTSVRDILDLQLIQDYDDSLLETVLDVILRKTPEKFQVKSMLVWLLYSARPLMIWEFFTVMNLEYTPEMVENFTQTCDTWLSGVVEVRYSEVRLRHPRIRDVLTKSHPTKEFLWNEVEASKAGFEMTKTCLDFLSMPDIQRVIDAIETKTSDTIFSSSTQGLATFISYAISYWPQHYNSMPEELRNTFPLDEYRESTMMTAWAKAYWILDNPITRPTEPWESAHPLLIALGVPTVPFESLSDHDIESSLFEAARHGRYDTARDILRQCPSSQSVLIEALVAGISSGNPDIVLHVLNHLSKGIDGNQNTVDWPPCLIYRAAWLGLNTVVKRLLEAGCSPDPGGPMTDKPRSSPLHQAVRFAHVDTIKVLLDFKADTNVLAVFDQSILHTAIYLGLSEVPKLLVEQCKVDMHRMDQNNETALHTATIHGATETMKYLLQMGADPHSGKDWKTLEDSSPGWLPLIDAAADGLSECVKVLLDGGADPNQPGPQGFNTALVYAAVKSHIGICRTLLEHGADPNHTLIKPPIFIKIVGADRLESSTKVELLGLMAQFGAQVDARGDRGETALLHAAMQDVGLVKYLLDAGASTNIPDEDDISPLHVASDEGSSDAIVELLLTKDHDLERRTVLGETPLFRAIENANMCKLLLEKGALPDATNNDGLTPLMIACLGGHIDTARVLLEHNARVDLNMGEDNERYPGYSPAHFASRGSGIPQILKLLADAGAPLCHSNRWGAHPIHLIEAVDTGRVLLQYRKRFDINHQDNWGRTALHNCVYIENSDLARLFINAGINVNLQDSTGCTPLHIAASLDNQVIARLLLAEDDIDVNKASPVVGSPLHRAAIQANFDMAKLLVDSGADVNHTVRRFNGTPLQCACLASPSEHGKDLVEYLIENGADVTAQGSLFGSAVSAAAAINTPEVLRLLLDRGASTNSPDAVGRMPIHLSAKTSYENYKIILRAGGNSTVKDKLGRNVLHWAAQNGQPKVVEDIISELGTSIIDEQDIDGWTPLLWSARGRGHGYMQDDEEFSKDQAEVVRILLRNGADRTVCGTVGDQSWSLRRIAIYSDADEDCMRLFEHGLGDRDDDSGSSEDKIGDAFAVAHLKDACGNEFEEEGPEFGIRPSPTSSPAPSEVRSTDSDSYVSDSGSDSG